MTTPKTLTGRVRWFDKSSGEGMVTADANDKSYYVHYSCIRPAAKRRDLNAGQHVIFTLYRNLYSERVEHVWPSEGVA